MSEDMGTGWRLLPPEPASDPVLTSEAVNEAVTASDPVLTSEAVNEAVNEGGYIDQRIPDLENDRFRPIDHADVLRTKSGRVAWAPPGSHDAAMAGVQQDASGHFSSVGTVEVGLHSNASGTRV